MSSLLNSLAQKGASIYNSTPMGQVVPIPDALTHPPVANNTTPATTAPTMATTTTTTTPVITPAPPPPPAPPLPISATPIPSPPLVGTTLTPASVITPSQPQQTTPASQPQPTTLPSQLMTPPTQQTAPLTQPMAPPPQSTTPLFSPPPPMVGSSPVVVTNPPMVPLRPASSLFSFSPGGTMAMAPPAPSSTTTLMKPMAQKVIPPPLPAREVKNDKDSKVSLKTDHIDTERELIVYYSAAKRYAWYQMARHFKENSSPLIFVYDLETTGLNVKQGACAIEIGCLLVSDVTISFDWSDTTGRPESDYFNHLIQFDKNAYRMNEVAMQVNGIDPNIVMDPKCPTAKEVVQMLLAWLNEWLIYSGCSEVIMVSYSGQQMFDVPFLMQLFADANEDLPAWMLFCDFKNVIQRRQSYHLYDAKQKNRLIDVFNRATMTTINEEICHKAIIDCVLVATCLHRMLSLSTDSWGLTQILLDDVKTNKAPELKKEYTQYFHSRNRK